MRGIWTSVGGWVVAAVALAGAVRAQEGDPEDFAAKLQSAQKKMQRGEWTAAENEFQEVLDGIAEQDAAKRPAAIVAAATFGLWTLDLRRGRFETVRDAIAGAPAELRDRREVVLLHAAALRRSGSYADAASLLETLVQKDAGDLQARHELGEALAADGRRAEARALWEQNAASDTDDGVQLAFRGRSHYRLGGRQHLEACSRDVTASLAKGETRPEARTTLALAKFAAWGEAARFPSGEPDCKKVLEQFVDDEDALLAYYEIRSANMKLEGAKTEHLLDRVLERNEHCVRAIVQRGSNVLDDRRYQDAARIFDAALTIDPNDRIALCHRAAAAWLLHDMDAYAAFRARALAGDPGWPECDRILGEHLSALYRFADAATFYAVANQTAPEDTATLLGMAKALIYTGEAKRAKELLEREKQLAAGIVEPWRNNALVLQQRLDDDYVVTENDKFAVYLHRQDADVLRVYLMPILLEASEVLGAKYGFQPQQRTKVEAFQTWDDFSFRTIGFRGFMALGACFGRLITLVSPVDSDLRKQDFMWEATAWHEYTHVLTLGLSNNRVPRWLTEGFSVYEEKVRDPSWERGMDRELFDAFHNQDIPPVHLLNRLFRGPRILFGYYQGGLIVEWIQKHRGFDKALDLLRAFGEDLETEAAFQKALGMASREFDKQFLAWIEQDKLRGMRLVHHCDDAAIGRLQLAAQRDRTNLQARIDLAWACLQRDNPVDAGRWLAEVLRADPENGQGNLVRAELLRRRKDVDQAIECWKRGFARGADDFDSRIMAGRTMLAAGDADGAIDQWQRAKACWPTCTEQENAPELLLGKVYRDRGDRTQAEMEMKAYCRRTARAFQPRYLLAEFEHDSGNRAEQARYLVECNRIDPFHRELHVRLGEAYEALGKTAPAALEYEVGAAVSPNFDRRYLQRGVQRPAEDAPEERAERGDLWLRAAKLRRTLGDGDRAAELLARIARDAAGSPAAEQAAELATQWRRK
jgi:tetratricopeptide (TPR) repeat protein